MSQPRLVDGPPTIPSCGLTGPSRNYPRALGEAVFYGLAGEAIRLIEPHTEADSAALLFQLLSAIGSIIGRGPSIEADGARHHINLFLVLVGESSKGRKGTSWNQLKNLLGMVDAEWLKDQVHSGLSSGEGLVASVRDGLVDDKRRLVLEGEFGQVLHVMDRPASTLSAVLRNAWDGADLRTMTRKEPLVATEPHISIIGHVTRQELRSRLKANDGANGFANRFLWVAVRRARLLPDGGKPPENELRHVANRLLEAVRAGSKSQLLSRSDETKRIWHRDYPRLSSDQRPGLFGSVTGRAEAQVMRLSALYAVLDKTTIITPAHHAAAMELWRYCEDSARWIFGEKTGDRVADRILDGLKEAGVDGLTRTRISRYLLRGHTAFSDLEAALDLLESSGLAVRSRKSTDGAPRELWHAMEFLHARQNSFLSPDRE